MFRDQTDNDQRIYIRNANLYEGINAHLPGKPSYWGYIASMPVDATKSTMIDGKRVFVLNPEFWRNTTVVIHRWDKETKKWDYFPASELVEKETIIVKIDHIDRCMVCNTHFFATMKGIKFCSNGCERNHRLERRSLTRGSRAKEHQEQACAHCGAAFIPKRSDSKFCSGKCRVAAHRQRGG